MKISNLAILAVLAAASPVVVMAQTPPTAVAPAAAPGDAALDAVVADYETYLKSVDPFSAASEGDVEAMARVPDLSRAFELAQRAPLTNLLNRVQAIDPASLSHGAAINHAFLLFILGRANEGLDYDSGALAFDSEGGPGTWALYIGGSTRLNSVAAAEAYIQRIRAFGTLYAQTTDNARRGLSTGLIQARSVTESAIQLARNDVAIRPDAEPLLAPFATLPANVPQAEKARLQAAGAAAVASAIVPARRAWLGFLETDYLPKTPTTPGIGNRPGGKALYAYLVRQHTTTELTPDQVHQIGLDEVARIRARMEVEMRAAGWTGDFAGFLNFLRTDPQFYAKTREELLEKASEMAKRADGGLPPLFATLPRLPYDVQPVPAQIEENYTTGRYNPGSMQNGIPGHYIVNTSKLDQRPLYELPALTLHEAVPGHHLQIALQQEGGGQPYFRRQANVTAFTEGWGLYSEYLGEEMGFYRTPYERFGRLSYEMWRACRLVADTGLHWLDWSEEQARACFRDNSALAPHNIETELQRYIGWPGQATAYKIGEIRLREIRERAERELGPKFNIRIFHDALLVEGPLPLALLDHRMDAWIAEQKAK
ncbi:DUF885 domain-containing protein [Brevundimonas nasdae]|uniref:DUF885 domain-containing protein n=1 Tax=Brevundimonas nasdae TaxID=172043 RepID=UPI003F694945